MRRHLPFSSEVKPRPSRAALAGNGPRGTGSTRKPPLLLRLTLPLASFEDSQGHSHAHGETPPALNMGVQSHGWGRGAIQMKPPKAWKYDRVINTQSNGALGGPGVTVLGGPAHVGTRKTLWLGFPSWPTDSLHPWVFPKNLNTFVVRFLEELVTHEEWLHHRVKNLPLPSRTTGWFLQDGRRRTVPKYNAHPGDACTLTAQGTTS